MGARRKISDKYKTDGNAFDVDAGEGVWGPLERIRKGVAIPKDPLNLDLFLAVQIEIFYISA